MPFTAEINAETRTVQGVTISTLYRHSSHPTMGAVVQWVAMATRALSRSRSLAYITIRDDTGTVVKHYRWQHDGGRAYCPSKRRRYR